MKKLIIILTIFALTPMRSYCISAVDSTKADSCGYALAGMCYSVNELSEVSFCKLRYFTNKFESNIITESQLVDSLTSASTELNNFVNTNENYAAVLVRNNYVNHSSITGFDNVMANRWDLDLDRRPNVGCSQYASLIWNCKAASLACIDAAAILCYGSGLGYPLCLAVSSAGCMVYFSICCSDADIAYPGCGGSGGGILWNPWIVDPPVVPSSAAACE